MKNEFLISCWSYVIQEADPPKPTPPHMIKDDPPVVVSDIVDGATNAGL